MPVLKQSASDAIRIFKNNKRRTNHRRDGDVKAEDRFMLTPAQTTAHRLRPGESIFTIGSCFARNVERHLDMMGFDVINHRIYDEAGRLAILPGIDNRYTPYSMLNEFRWALDPAFSVDYEDALYKVDRGLCFDPHMHYAMRRFPVTTALERREYLNECNRSITRCQTIIITLGLAEAWWDSKLGIYLNWSPQMRWIEQEPDRFEFHLLGPDDVSDALEQIYALLQTRGHPDFHILLTVSPIEMMATFRPMDASVANMHSKSILRAAAGAFVEAHPNVDYLPSFEIAMLSDPWAVWDGDRVHIQDDAG
ncbi:MAG: GSCFA domain-containing protein, partial [Rhodospirillales bacterium]